MTDELPVPDEIPWRRAATTQHLTDSRSPGDDTTTSLFYYEPASELVEDTHPGKRLLYLKVTVSVSPLVPDSAASHHMAELPKGMLAGGLPVWHAILDLRLAPGQGAGATGTSAYFHAASPIRREMIETGILGAELTEGEAESVSIGKSASQLHETMSSHARTKSSGWSVGGSISALSGGYSSRSTGTTVDSERDVDQYVESTVRDASQERRELLSHTTTVSNVLSLLHAKHLGSPYLRWELWPRPVPLWSGDASDPNLWYSEFLRRRSSGLEGVQEFVAVVVVNRDDEFCIDLTLRRFAVLDALPKLDRSTFDVDDTFGDWLRLNQYLSAVYPRGTPVEDLDVDVWPHMVVNPGKPDQMPHAVVYTWFPLRYGVLLSIESPEFTSQKVDLCLYKHVDQAFEEMQRWQYERDLARSPLERGQVLLATQELTRCFEVTTDDAMIPKGPVTVNHGPTQEVAHEIPHQHFDQTSATAYASPSARYRWSAAAWNAADRSLRHALVSYTDADASPVRADSPRVVDLVLATWARLDRRDERNLDLAAMAARFDIDDRELSELREAGVTRLSDLAVALRADVDTTELVDDWDRALAGLDPDIRRRLPQIEPPAQVSRAVLAEVRSLVRDALAREADGRVP